MSAQTMQFGSTRVVLLSRGTEHDVESVAQQFHLHPHDQEALLSVAASSSLQPDREYLRSTILWPSRSGQRVVLAEMQIITGSDWLILVDMIGVGVWAHFPTVAHDLPDPTPAGLLALALEQLSQSLAGVALAQSVAAVTANHLQLLAPMFERLIVAMDQHQYIFRQEDREALHLAIFRIKQLPSQLTSAAHGHVGLGNDERRTRRVMQGYAVASAAVLVVVLILMSRGG